MAKKKDHRNEQRRKAIGYGLMAVGLICCLMSLTGIRRSGTDSFAASGRNGAFETPAPPDGTISVNFAGIEELTELPGIGETMAQAIIDERERNGLFQYPEDLMAVKGIGEAKLAKMRPLLDMATE